MKMSIDIIRKLAPYKHLEYAAGSGEDFVCFDFIIDKNKAAIASTLNSETGGFIQNFEEPWVGPKEELVAVAKELIGNALGWAVENEVRLDMKGWNQDPAYLIRAIEFELGIQKTAPRRRRNWRNDL